MCFQQLAPHRAYASQFAAGWHKGKLSEGSRYRRGHLAKAGRNLAGSVSVLELPGRARWSKLDAIVAQSTFSNSFPCTRGRVLVAKIGSHFGSQTRTLPHCLPSAGERRYL